MKLIHLVHIRRATLLLPVCAALGGCMTSSPIWEAHFGEAVKADVQAQIIDPQAGEHVRSTPGIDGKAAAASMDIYDKSYVQPQPEASPMMDVGSGSGGSGSSSGSSSQ
jgi:hypothetical protein